MPTKPLSKLEAQVGESVQTVENLEIEAGKVEEFVRAFRDDYSVFRDEEVAQEAGYDDIPAPLTFTRVAYFPRYRPDDIGSDLGFDLGLRKENVLHGEQEYEYERPLVVGDVLSGTTTLVDVYQSEGSRGGTMTFCVYETEYRDQNDELVLTERLTRIETGGDSEEGDE